MTNRKKRTSSTAHQNVRPALETFALSMKFKCQQDTLLYFLFMFTMVLLCGVAKYVPLIKTHDTNWNPDHFIKFSDKNITNLHHPEETPSSKLETASIERWPPDGVHPWLTNPQDNGRNLKEEPPDRIGVTSRICSVDSKGHSGRNSAADGPILLIEVGEPMKNEPGESSIVDIGHQPPASHRIHALYYV